MVLTKEEEIFLEETDESEKWFNEDEIYHAQPEIFEMIEDGDLKGLTNYLRQVGGF